MVAAGARGSRHVGPQLGSVTVDVATVPQASKHFGPGGFPGAARRRDNDSVVRLSSVSRQETWEDVPASGTARGIEPCSPESGSSGTSARPAARGGRGVEPLLPRRLAHRTGGLGRSRGNRVGLVGYATDPQHGGSGWSRWPQDEVFALDARVGCASWVGHRMRQSAPALRRSHPGRSGHRTLAALVIAAWPPPQLLAYGAPAACLRRAAASGPGAGLRHGTVAAAPQSRFPPTHPHPWSSCAHRTLTPRRLHALSLPRSPTLRPSQGPTDCSPRGFEAPTLPTPSPERGIRPRATCVAPNAPCQ